MDVRVENKRSLLTTEEMKVVESLKKDYNKFAWLIISGVFAILVGTIVGGSTLLYPVDKTYAIAGVFFITIGILTIRDSLRNKKIYQILGKLLSNNEQ